jgi:energy-coupling factor transporter ATP-binding protein EcfA2
MKLETVEIENFKAFWQPVGFALSPHCTFIVGKNNAGKTAALEALSLSRLNTPHRGPSSIRVVGAEPSEASKITVKFLASGSEIDHILDTARVVKLALPQGTPDVRDFFRSVRASSAGNARFTVSQSMGSQPQRVAIPWYHNGLRRGDPYALASFSRNPGDPFGFDVTSESQHWPGGKLDQELSALAFSDLQRSVFRFTANRQVSRYAHVGPDTEMKSDASNLVPVLDNLQAEKRRFAEYEAYVKRILPEVGEIRPKSTKDGTKEVLIAFSESLNRTDLTFSLDDVGSGTAQVLALVHVITMSERPRLILIDEPNAFLHPGAVRELMQLVAHFQQHQYVIATHVPIALDVIDNAQVVVLDRSNEGTAVARVVDRSRTEDQRALLAAVGSSLQDSFGADHVVWVEGPTECEVLRIASELIAPLPRGTVLLPIVHTGDLDQKRRVTMSEVYTRLSTGGGLLPSHVAFVLDAEVRTTVQRNELSRRLQGRVHFLPVRMLENLFLDPHLFSAFLSATRTDWDPSNASGVQSGAQIAAYWDGLSDAQRYGTDVKRTASEQAWRAAVHGATVLEDTVATFTAQRLEYRKVTHGALLARLALQTNRELLQPAADTLRGALGGS